MGHVLLCFRSPMLHHSLEGKQQAAVPGHPRTPGFEDWAGGSVTSGHPAKTAACAQNPSASHGPSQGLHLGVGLLLSLMQVLGRLQVYRGSR